MFQYTDGVTEATYDAAAGLHAKEAMFGEARLLEAVSSGDTDPNALLPHVRQKIDAFVGSAPQFDDITMLCLRYHGAARGKGEPT